MKYSFKKNIDTRQCDTYHEAKTVVNVLNEFMNWIKDHAGYKVAVIMVYDAALIFYYYCIRYTCNVIKTLSYGTSCRWSLF